MPQWFGRGGGILTKARRKNDAVLLSSVVLRGGGGEGEGSASKLSTRDFFGCDAPASCPKC